MAWRTQRGWRLCGKCQGLWFSGSTGSRCPAGGAHSQAGSANYSLVLEAASAPGQTGWRLCGKCQGLWFGVNPPGPCPAGGSHSKTGSGNYTIAQKPGAGEQGWRWCGKCQGMWLSTNGTDGRCPAGGGHSATGSGDFRQVEVTHRIRIHTKVLTPPETPIDTLMHNMREVFAAAKIDVEWASTENLNFPGLDDLDVEFCIPGFTTAEQDRLYANRNNVGPNEIAVYFVRSTFPPSSGCTAFAPGMPSAAVVQTGTQWTCAHEVGHVLGLSHTNDNNRLMTGKGTANITNPPPDLISSEIAIMTASAFAVRV